MEEFNFPKILAKLRHIAYGNLSFRAVCPICDNPVDVDDSIDVDRDGNYVGKSNAMCMIHGRVQMPFDGKIIT